MKGAIFINNIVERGRYWFSTAELADKLGISKPNANGILKTLEKNGYIARPVRGFSIIIPPEYRRLKCLPPDELALSLMEYWGMIYYVGLLSAAEYHGAAPQRPQTFQIVVPANLKPISCGTVRVSFIARRNTKDIPVKTIKTKRGYIRVSSPDATAFDLVGYSRRIGGLDAVAAILTELHPALSSEGLLSAAQFSPVVWGQRLGYLLEIIGAGKTIEPLRQYVNAKTKAYALLRWSAPPSGHKNQRWRLIINTPTEVEI